jgi:hypothetical protein
VLVYGSEKIQKEYVQSAVAIRLVVDAIQIYAAGHPIKVLRVKDRTKFEKGVHSTGLAVDIFIQLPQSELEYICARANARFQTTVATLVEEPANLPSGKRLDLPHIHVQIQFDWLANPRAFLKAYGFLQPDPLSN